ncbi:hypothetical protein [Massilia aquatica]|uniref:Uncharacterized protein n=1 Tax=Massilia aquatica TaxID=2609000 RepID=A0ABX0LXK5_9BURK|nr:hypothetical protein [Massilia aquatica]NHZ39267.1 hypothetical protein [Massilia aquatica]
MATKEEIKRVFMTFISTEEVGLAQGVDPDWYPQNWPSVVDNIKKAPSLLDESELAQLYYFLCRRNRLPGAEVGKHYRLLDDAYRRHAPLMKKPCAGYFTSSISRLQGLMIFGADHLGHIASNAGLEDYLLHRAAHQQISKYSRIPGMLAKPERFVPVAGDKRVVERICAALDFLGFIQDDWHTPASPRSPEYFSCVSLPFWGAMFTLMLSPLPLAQQSVAQFKALEQLPRRAEQMEILARFEDASKAYLERT